MKILLIVALAAILIPAGISAAPPIDTLPSLSVRPTSDAPFFYRADDNSTVLVGEVRNDNAFPVTDVQVIAAFYDDASPLPEQVVSGYSLLEVIPPGGISPYILRTADTDVAIRQATMAVAGFTSSATKQQVLDVSLDLSGFAERMYLAGTVTNGASAPSENTRVHVAVYDPFIPPRLLDVHTIYLGSIGADSALEFVLDEQRSHMAHSAAIFAESGNFGANVLELDMPPLVPPAHRATIHDTAASGTPDRTAPSAGSPVLVESVISVQGEPLPAGYVYYVQIRESEQSPAEFVGVYESGLDGPGFQNPGVEWIPPRPGVYNVETFVWSSYGGALAAPGPIVTVEVI